MAEKAAKKAKKRRGKQALIMKKSGSERVQSASRLVSHSRNIPGGVQFAGGWHDHRFIQVDTTKTERKI